MPNNITFDFRGNIPNTELMEEYQNSFYDLFINVSSSEGIPVSIMEASSFGIPCIATDVGGTRELVHTGQNGILLPSDPSPENVRDAILSILAMDDKGYETLRHTTREYWNAHFNAEKNYREFVDELLR